MIIKSSKRDPLVTKHVKVLKAVRVKRPIIDDRKYVLTNGVHEDKNLVILFDIIAQRVVYKIISNKDVNELYEDVFSQYNKRDIRIIDPESLKFLLEEIKQTIGASSSHLYDIKRVEKQISTTKKHSPHAQSVIDTYKYIDKYRVGLNPIILFLQGENKTIIDLVDEDGGIDKGIHRLIYEHTVRKYRYYYMSELIKETNILEDIFK